MRKRHSEKTSTYFHLKTSKKKTKLMTCTHEGCTNTFEAYPHARFCEFHKDPLTRPIDKKKEEVTTFKFKHTFPEPMVIEKSCACCGSPYRITVYPSTYEYPKFCPDHRSEFKRNSWRETHGKK